MFGSCAVQRSCDVHAAWATQARLLSCGWHGCLMVTAWAQAPEIPKGMVRGVSSGAELTPPCATWAAGSALMLVGPTAGLAHGHSSDTKIWVQARATLLSR